MTVRILISDPQPAFNVVRDEDGNVVLTGSASCGKVAFNIGNDEDSAGELHEELLDVVDKLTKILDLWEDTPEDEDGWVILDNGKYVVRFDNLEKARGIPSREIAIRLLAEVMFEARMLPHAWLSGEHGPATESIDEKISAEFDPGTRDLKPLEGVEYTSRALVRIAEGGDLLTVDRDFGDLGIMLHVSGDPSVTVFVRPEDRISVSLAPSDDEGDDE